MKSHSKLLKNCFVIATVNDNYDTLENSDVYIEGNQIVEIGPGLMRQADEVIDCSGKLVLPGFVNTHHHLFQLLTRNLPQAQNCELFDWLKFHYRIWRHIKADDIKVSSTCGFNELLLTGCTTTADHHYLFPQNSEKNLIDVEIAAAKECGIRFHPTRGSMTYRAQQGELPPDDLLEKDSDVMADSIRLIDSYHNPDKFSMCRLALSPCTPFNASRELFRDTAILAREKKVRLHTHLCETKDEEDYCKSVFGMRPLEYMQELDWIGNDVWFCHGVHFNDQEIKILGQSKTGISHCPSANLRLGSGIAPVRKLIDSGANVSIAVDGSASNDSSNMLKELQTTLMLHRIKSGVSSMSAKDVLYMATRGGAAVLGRDDIGSIEVGKAADIIAYDMDTLAYAGALTDPIAALFFCGFDQRVWLSMVNGDILVRDKQLVYFEEHGLAHEAHRITKKLISY